MFAGILAQHPFKIMIIVFENVNLLSCALDLIFNSILLPLGSPCLERHPSPRTEYWLYYETWGVFHNHSTFLQNHLLDFIEITKKG